MDRLQIFSQSKMAINYFHYVVTLLDITAYNGEIILLIAPRLILIGHYTKAECLLKRPLNVIQSLSPNSGFSLRRFFVWFGVFSAIIIDISSIMTQNTPSVNRLQSEL